METPDRQLCHHLWSLPWFSPCSCRSFCWNYCTMSVNILSSLTFSVSSKLFSVCVSPDANKTPTTWYFPTFIYIVYIRNTDYMFVQSGLLRSPGPIRFFRGCSFFASRCRLKQWQCRLVIIFFVHVEVGLLRGLINQATRIYATKRLHQWHDYSYTSLFITRVEI